MVSKIKYFWSKYSFEITSIAFTFIVAYMTHYFNSVLFVNDDQFTLYRYIANIAEGNGFVFNIGERVLGSTTPLFTLIAALIKFIFSSISVPSIVAYLNIIFLSVSALFFYRLSSLFLSKRFSLAATIIFALNLSWTVPTGMETPLFILLVLIFLNCLFSEKYYWSSIFLSLAILTRPDAGLIAVLALIFWWQKVGILKTIKLLAVSVLVALPWLVFATAYFGSFIPQSLITKLHIGDIVNQSPLQAFKVQLSHLSRIYWGKIIDPNNLPIQVLVNLIPFFVLVYFGVKKKLNKDTWIIFAIPVLYFISYSISNPVMFAWYLHQTELFWILISFIGISFIFEKIKVSGSQKKYIAVIFFAVLFIGPTYSWAKKMIDPSEGSKVPLYKIGMYIKEHMEPGDKIGLSNIGIVSFITHAYVIDFIGLTRAESVGFYPIKDPCLDKNNQYVISPNLVMDTKPDWVVAGEKEWVKCFVEGKWFTSNYSPVYSINTAKVWKLNK